MRIVRNLLIITLIALPFLNAEQSEASLVAYWKFDESAGATAANSSGSATNYDGTLTNFANPNAQWVAGKFGNALKFDDANDVVQLNANAVDLAAEWTLSAWFSTPLPNTGGYHTLFRGNHSAGGNHPILSQPGTNILGTFDNNTGSGFHSAGYDMDTLNSPGWAHIVAVGSGGSTTFYINGVDVGTSNYQSTTDIFAIGNYQNGSQRFTDLLDDVAIWDEALTSTTIQGLANETLNPLALEAVVPEPSSMVLYGISALIGLLAYGRRRRRQAA